VQKISFGAFWGSEGILDYSGGLWLSWLSSLLQATLLFSKGSETNPNFYEKGAKQENMSQARSSWESPRGDSTLVVSQNMSFRLFYV
jgi:hypothetical protein